jgi:hypothetical protein
MFTLDATIDAVQTGNKNIVNTFVQNESIKEALVKVIDTQADMTKKFVKQTTDTVSVFASEFTKAAQEATKFDFTKSYANMAETFKVKK